MIDFVSDPEWLIMLKIGGWTFMASIVLLVLWVYSCFSTYMEDLSFLIGAGFLVLFVSSICLLPAGLITWIFTYLC